MLYFEKKWYFDFYSDYPSNASSSWNMQDVQKDV